MREIADTAHYAGYTHWHWRLGTLFVWFLGGSTMYLVEAIFTFEENYGLISIPGYLVSVVSCGILWLCLERFKPPQNPRDMIDDIGIND
ncbi:MAG: hypothetical protein AB8F95_01340 [Bacteroidia bacterium]